MTTPNSIIADLSHEIDRLQKIGNLMLETLISAESFVAKFEYSEHEEVPSLLGNIRYSIDEAHHG
jgi:hypothetical protein